MPEDTQHLLILVGGALLFSFGAFVSCNVSEHRATRESNFKDSTPVVESCVKHPAGRKVVVQ